MSSRRSRLNALVDAIRRRRAREYPPSSPLSVPTPSIAADPPAGAGEVPALRTHYVPPFTRRRPDGTQEAFCGAYVTEAEHSPEPDCQICIALICQDADDLAAVIRSAGGGY